jgi:hypothetical protein
MSRRAECPRPSADRRSAFIGEAVYRRTNAAPLAGRSVLQEPGWTIVEAVCLEELVPEDVFGRGFGIYVKRVAVLGPDLYLLAWL